MRTLVYSLALTLLSLSTWAKGASYTVEKSAKVSLAADLNVNLSIDTKNTITEISLWEEEKVQIEAHFSYRGEEEHPKITEFLKEFENNVKKGVEGNRQSITINTFRSMPSKVKVGWEEFAFFNWTFSPDEVEIKYSIKVPSKAKVQLKHSYRRLNLKGSFEDLDLEQYSGKLEANELKKARLSMKYGEARIGKIQNGEIQLYENDLSGDDWGRIVLKAKYSNIKVGKVEFLDTESYESELSISELQNLSGNFKYSRMECLELRYGNISAYETKFFAKDVNQLFLGVSKYSRYEIDKLQSLKLGQAYEDKMSIEHLGKMESAESKYCQYKIARLEEGLVLTGYESQLKLSGVGDSGGTIKIDGKYLKLDLKLGDRVYQLNAVLKYGSLDYPEHLVEAQVMEKGDNLNAILSSKKSEGAKFKVLLNGYEVDARIH